MATSNSFREEELVLRKQRINGEWTETYFPKVGGRLRLAHEGNQSLSIQTDVIRFDDTCAVVKAAINTEKGTFCGFGTASAQRDARLADSLLELAETRSIARALRFSGYGVEYTGAEEVSHVMPDAEQQTKQTEGKASETAVNDKGKPSKPETKPQRCGIERAQCNGSATSAQVRALFALSKRAKYSDEDISSLLSPLNASTFQELSRDSASQLIAYLQTEIAA